MVNVCPSELDPREHVEAFVSDPQVKTLAGLREEGVWKMMDVVEAEVRKQEPGSEIIILDRDSLCEERIDLPRELSDFLLRKADCGKKVNVLVRDDLPIIGWQQALDVLRGKDAQVYVALYACRNVPVCTKLF